MKTATVVTCSKCDGSGAAVRSVRGTRAVVTCRGCAGIGRIVAFKAVRRPKGRASA